MQKEKFALRLAKLRLKKGVSARMMSHLIGQNDGYINSIEAGKSMPSFEAFFSICDYLGITPQEFFDYDSTDPSRIDAIAEDMKDLSDEQLETIASLVKGLAKNK